MKKILLIISPILEQDKKYKENIDSIIEKSAENNITFVCQTSDSIYFDLMSNEFDKKKYKEYDAILNMSDDEIVKKTIENVIQPRVYLCWCDYGIDFRDRSVLYFEIDNYNIKHPKTYFLPKGADIREVTKKIVDSFKGQDEIIIKQNEKEKEAQVKIVKNNPEEILKVLTKDTDKILFQEKMQMGRDLIVGVMSGTIIYAIERKNTTGGFRTDMIMQCEYKKIEPTEEMKKKCELLSLMTTMNFYEIKFLFDKDNNPIMNKVSLIKDYKWIKTITNIDVADYMCKNCNARIKRMDEIEEELVKDINTNRILLKSDIRARIRKGEKNE